MARADVIVSGVGAQGGLQRTGAGVDYIVQKNGSPATFYYFYTDSASDFMYRKSTDGGFTWSNPVTIFAGTMVAQSVWYRRMSNLASDIVDMAYIESGGADVLYRSLDLSSDTLGTQTTAFNGTSTASGGALSICTDRGGHIRIVFNIDNGTEDGCVSSTDDGATWGDTIADPTEGANADQFYLLPGWNADTHDMMLIFVDSSANGLSVKRYDDSGDAWTEATIIADASFVDQTAGTAFPHVACAVDIANSRNVVIAWNAVDAANQDLKAFTIDDTTVTTLTDVVTNATDDCGLAGLAIDTGTNTWYAFYGGKSDGSETYNTAISLNYKTSTDSGANWSAETALSNLTRTTDWLICTPRFSTNYLVGFNSDLPTDEVLVSVNVPSAGVAESLFGGGLLR